MSQSLFWHPSAVYQCLGEDVRELPTKGAPLSPRTMALQRPLWNQIPAVQTTQLPAPNLLGAAGGGLYPLVMSQGRNANSSVSPGPLPSSISTQKPLPKVPAWANRIGAELIWVNKAPKGPILMVQCAVNPLFALQPLPSLESPSCINPSPAGKVSHPPVGTGVLSKCRNEVDPQV